MLAPNTGKTTLLVAIANAVSHTNGLYLAYNRSVAIESKRKFPSTTTCSTTHALAYQAIVKSLKLKIGTFSYRDITERIKYEQKCQIIDTVRAFCLSKYVSFTEYATQHDLPLLYTKLVPKYLTLMQEGKIECTHDFYLKLFHILLHNNEIHCDPYDFVMLDEAGDLNEVTLEIFKLLPTKLRIAVGDKHQNIYMFNDTINCFKVLESQGKLFKLTKSFRVSKDIATRIEYFCKAYLDPNIEFKGTTSLDANIKTSAFIARTNGALIQRMIECNNDGIPYSLMRKAKEIFRLPLMICALKPQGFITDPAYKHLQTDIDLWYEDSELRTLYSNPLTYILAQYPDDLPLQQAIKLILKHRKNTIIDTYEIARKHETQQHDYVLATAHSCKGAEFDEVTLADDINTSVEKPINLLLRGVPLNALEQKQLENLNLYYVACTRAAKKLNNAKWLYI